MRLAKRCEARPSLDLWHSYLVTGVLAFLVLVISYVPTQTFAQVQYNVCQDICNNNFISVDYPSDYVKQGQGSAWFVAFLPTQSSISSVSIFVDYTQTQDQLGDYFNSYVGGLSSSSSLQNVQIISTTDTSLGGYPAKSVLYKYINPSDGTAKTAEDIMAYNRGGIYTLSFLENSDSFGNDFYIVEHVLQSFKFL